MARLVSSAKDARTAKSMPHAKAAPQEDTQTAEELLLRLKRNMSAGCESKASFLDGPTCLADIALGAKVPGDCGSDPTVQPEWMDEARLDRAKAFMQAHAFTLTIAWHVSLVIGFNIESLLSALVFTGRSDTAAKALERYMQTFKHLVWWHLESVFDPNTDGYKSCQSVRGLHAAVRAALTAQIPDQVWMSQYDLASVQTGFMGLMTIVPEKLGLVVGKEAIADYVFFWKCAARQLGVEDKYNLCSLGPDVSANIVWEVVTEVLLPAVRNPPSRFRVMAQAYCDGLNLLNPLTAVFPFFTVDSTMAVSYWALDQDIPALDMGDTFRFYVYRALFLMIRYAPKLELLLSWVMVQVFTFDGPPVGLGLGCPFTGRSFGRRCPNGNAAAAAEGTKALVLIKRIFIIVALLLLVGVLLLLGWLSHKEMALLLSFAVAFALIRAF